MIQEKIRNKYLVYFEADGVAGRAFVTLENMDAFTEKGVLAIEEYIKKDSEYENVILLNMIPLKS